MMPYLINQLIEAAILGPHEDASILSALDGEEVRAVGGHGEKRLGQEVHPRADLSCRAQRHNKVTCLQYPIYFKDKVHF